MSAPGTDTQRPAGAKGKAKATTDREQLGEGFINGNLTADPELRYTPSGRAVCKLRVAFNIRVQDPESGTWTDGETEFYGVEVWGLQGEHCAEYLKKGTRIVACGQWSRRTWDDAEGNTREVTELVARDIGPSLLFGGARVITTQRQGARP